MTLNINTYEMEKSIRKWKKELIAAIKNIVEDYFHESGYVKSGKDGFGLRNNDGSYVHHMLCTYGTRADEEGDDVTVCYYLDPKDEDSFGVEGFYEDGVMTGGYGGGMATMEYEELSIELLIWLYELVKETHTELQ